MLSMPELFDASRLVEFRGTLLGNDIISTEDDLDRILFETLALRGESSVSDTLRYQAQSIVNIPSLNGPIVHLEIRLRVDDD